MEQAPQAETLDRKELLEQQFEQSAEAQPRDEVGRYAEKQAEQQAAEPADEPVWRKPPSSWKKEYHEYWSKADPKIQEYAWQPYRCISYGHSSRGRFQHPAGTNVAC